jgi:site-specific recombinase XerD
VAPHVRGLFAWTILELPVAGHPFRRDETRALRRLQRDSNTPSPFVFVSERGSPFTTAGFARMIERAAAGAGL